MIRKEIYSIKEILSKTILTENNKKISDEKIIKNNIEGGLVDFHGDLINMTSQRYQLFKLKGTVCCECGLHASFFAKERHFRKKDFDPNDIKFHFNLYGFDVIDNQLKEILFTKDHIIPKSAGGKNNMDNYNVMCHPCNREKDNRTPREVALEKWRNEPIINRVKYCVKYINKQRHIHSLTGREIELIYKKNKEENQLIIK